MECKIPDCHNEAGKPGTAAGLCSSHYHRMLRYGDPTAKLRRTPSYKNVQCAVDHCREPAKSLGFCTKHYARLRRSRQSEHARKSAARRFKDKTNRGQEQAIGRQRPCVCDVCGERGYAKGRSPYIVYDHNHATGAARGWLCDRCNKTLGLVKDDPELLEKLVRYLRFTQDGKVFEV